MNRAILALMATLAVVPAAVDALSAGSGSVCLPPEEPYVPSGDAEFREYADMVSADFERYFNAITDYFICMDSNNIRNTMRIFGDDKDGKVCKMMSFAGMNRDVSDPWYSGDFEQAYNDIYSGCKGIFEKFKCKA